MLTGDSRRTSRETTFSDLESNKRSSKLSIGKIIDSFRDVLFEREEQGGNERKERTRSVGAFEASTDFPRASSEYSSSEILDFYGSRDRLIKSSPPGTGASESEGPFKDSEPGNRSWVTEYDVSDIAVAGCRCWHIASKSVFANAITEWEQP